MTAGPRKAVFLDRDGVLNRGLVRDGKPYPPRRVEELEILPGVPEALERLRQDGYLLICVTNQPDVSRGSLDREVLEAIHDRLAALLPLDEIRACCHDNADECDCRKPRPGLLVEAAGRHGIALDMSWMIGDRWRDIEAGKNAGCHTILIDYAYAEPGPRQAPDRTVHTLTEAADWILEGRFQGGSNHD